MENPFLYSHKTWTHGLEPTDWWCLRFYVHTNGKSCDWGIQSLCCCQSKTSVINCSTIPKTLQQLHTELCNMTFPHNPAEAVNKRELQWERKPIIIKRSKGVLMAIRYTKIPLTPSLLLLNSWNFSAYTHFSAFSI